MNKRNEVILRTVFIGIGATLTMDIWNIVLKQFGIKSMNFANLGRWFGHLPNGQWFHANINSSPSIQGELLIGWIAHYMIGISFAALLISLYGLKWARSPKIFPPVFIGIVTIIGPWLILQPALGMGIAFSNAPNPTFAIIKSLGTHTVYGIGLYLTALILSYLIPVPSKKIN